MDILDAMSQAIRYRDQLPPNDLGKMMIDADMLRVIQDGLNQNRPSINYADPTWDQATARADRSRR